MKALTSGNLYYICTIQQWEEETTSCIIHSLFEPFEDICIVLRFLSTHNLLHFNESLFESIAEMMTDVEPFYEVNYHLIVVCSSKYNGCCYAISYESKYRTTFQKYYKVNLSIIIEIFLLSIQLEIPHLI